MNSIPKLSYLPVFEGRETLYRRLDTHNGEFRILSLCPNEDFSAPLECSISMQSIMGTRKQYHYRALSYYWGLANDLSYVIVHGSDEGAPTISCNVPITRNLDTFLRHLRTKPNQHGLQSAYKLWTDALCINQRGAEERSLQVRVMHYIFKNADSVEIWLGDHNALAENGLRALAALCKQEGRPGLVNITPDEFHVEYDLEQGTSTDLLFKDVQALLDLPYWRRGWVFQEVCGNDCVHLQLGNIRCRVQCWDHVRIQAFKLLTERYPCLPRGMELLSVFALKHALIPFVVASRHLTSQPPNVFTLLKESLFESKFWQTSDPRDSVFALSAFFPPYARIEPNYNESVEEIFAKATLAMLQWGVTTANKKALQSWIVPSNSPYLPSWVHDFTTHERQRSLPLGMAISCIQKF